jgi:hypothetical protein
MNENLVELCRRHHADWAHALADCANNFGSRATAATLDLIERNYGSLKWQGKMDTFAVMRQIFKSNFDVCDLSRGICFAVCVFTSSTNM